MQEASFSFLALGSPSIMVIRVAEQRRGKKAMMGMPPIVVNGEVKDEIVRKGVEALREGRDALDVAEAIARAVEDDREDHSVGTGGLPNILGEVELDAAIMEGRSRSAGAVAALKGFLHPISVARAVMQRLPHVLLVGEGAARFAREIGAEEGELLTQEAQAIWKNRLLRVGMGLEDVIRASSLPPSDTSPPLIEITRRVLAYREGQDTMNVLVRDREGHFVVAVTTSGIAWKYPGRVGDSPVVGAGFYADDRYGAAACMGVGEVSLRHVTALRAILELAAGKSVEEAGRRVMRDLLPLCRDLPQYRGASEASSSLAWLRLLLVDREGRTGGFCTHDRATYKVQSVEEDRPRVLACEWITTNNLTKACGDAEG